MYMYRMVRYYLPKWGQSCYGLSRSADVIIEYRVSMMSFEPAEVGSYEGRGTTSRGHHAVKMAASGGDELAEDWWETKGSMESGSSRKRSKDSAYPLGMEAVTSPVPKRKRKKKSAKSAVEADEVRPAARSSASGGAKGSAVVVRPDKG